MFGSHLTAFSALAQTSDPIVIKNAAGQVTARLTYDGYWGLGNAFHPNAGTISLTAGRKYWSVKSATGAVLFAIDCESGEAWSSGPVNVGLNSIDPVGSTFSAKSADGTTVFSISPDGTANATGNIWGFFVQNFKTPAAMTDTSPPDYTQQGLLARLKEDYDNPPPANIQNIPFTVPEPMAQLRIGTGSTDVSNKVWRAHFVPRETDQTTYGLRLGFRTSVNGDLFTSYFSNFADQHGSELDTQVDYVGGWNISDTGVVSDFCRESVSPWPIFPSPGLYQFEMSASDSDGKTDQNGAVLAYPNDTRDTTQTAPRTAVFLYDMQFFPPAKIPQGKPDDKPVWLGCQLYPGNTLGIHSMTVKIYDPSSIVDGVPTRWRKWTNTDYWVMAKWDGILYVNGNENQPVYSESGVFMEGMVTFKTTIDGQPLEESAYLTDNAFAPRLAISLSGMAWAEKAGLELEVGTPFTAMDRQQNLGFTPDNFKWDFRKKVFKDIDKDVYTSTDLLGDASGIVNVEHPVGRYITGAKSSAPNTDLGPVTASLTASDSENHSASASLDFELVVNNAEITFYYTPYEWQYRNLDEDPETTVSVKSTTSTQTTNIFTFASFLTQADTEGNGRLYRIRTAANMDFTSGTVPTANQKYIWKNGNHWEFSSIAKNSMEQQLTVGTAARFEVPVGTSGGPHYSYYNWSTYVVHDLKQEVDVKLAECLRQANSFVGSNNPYRQTAKPFQSSSVTIKDTGPFDHVKENVTEKHNPRDLGHLDIYLEEADTEYGISEDSFVIIDDSNWNTTGRKVTKNDNQ
jgi:hypothetical protein